VLRQEGQEVRQRRQKGQRVFQGGVGEEGVELGLVEDCEQEVQEVAFCCEQED
jgi:hypothetical protein